MKSEELTTIDVEELKGYSKLEDIEVDSDKPLLQEFKKILRFQLGEILENYIEFTEAPKDPETTHQFRVKIRSFRSSLSFIKPELDEDQYVKLQSKMRELAQKLGYVRELDVLKEEWQDIAKEEETEDSHLVNFLESKRSLELKKVKDDVIKSTMPTLEYALTWIENNCKPNVSNLISLGEFFNKRIKKWKKKIKKEIKVVDTNHLDEIHAVRIRFKKLRYIMNIMNDLLSLEKNDDVKSYKKWQETLGEYTDVKRHLEILEELSKEAESHVYEEIQIMRKNWEKDEEKQKKEIDHKFETLL